MARFNQKIVIDIDLDIKGLTRSVGKAIAAIGALEAALESVDGGDVGGDMSAAARAASEASGAAAKFADNLALAGQSVMGVDDVIIGMAGEMDDVSDSTSTFARLVTNLSDRGDRRGGRIGRMFSSISETLGGLGDTAKGVGETLDAVTSISFGPFSLDPKELAKMAKFGKLVAGVGLALLAVAGIISTLVAFLGVAIAQATTFAAILGTGLFAEAKNIKEEFENINTTGEAMRAQFNAIKRAFGEAFAPLINNEVTAQIFREFLNVIVAIADGFSEVIAPILDIKGSSNDVLGTWDSIRETFDKNLVPFMKQFGLLIQATMPMIEGAMNTLLRAGPGILKWFREVSTEGRDLGDTISLVMGILGDLGSIGADLLPAILPVINVVLWLIKAFTGLSEIVSDFFAFGVSAFATFLDFLVGLIPGLTGVKDIFDGILDVIDAMKQGLDDFVRLVGVVTGLPSPARRHEEVIQANAPDDMSPDVQVQEGDTVLGDKSEGDMDKSTNVDADPDQKAQLSRIVKDAIAEANGQSRRQQGL